MRPCNNTLRTNTKRSDILDVHSFKNSNSKQNILVKKISTNCNSKKPLLIRIIFKKWALNFFLIVYKHLRSASSFSSKMDSEMIISTLRKEML